MPLLDSTDRRPVHFVGIAGAGMRALAELFVRRGIAVTGCDAAMAGVAELRALGIAVADGHAAEHVVGARALVVTSAMSPDHPELQAARGAGVPIVRRAEALGEAVHGGTLVAVAGTHGKTTTTVMTTEALAAAGLHPTAVAGGRVEQWGGNLRYDSDRLFVVEADEYDRSFLAPSPSSPTSRPITSTRIATSPTSGRRSRRFSPPRTPSCSATTTSGRRRSTSRLRRR